MAAAMLLISRRAGVLANNRKRTSGSEEALLKKITVANYRQDPYYAPIVRAVEGLLREKGFVAPVELFIRMNLLSQESAEDWRRGQISYLERVIRCNLSKASRILRILRMHAHDLDLKPSLTVYKRWTKGSRPLLRFSKTGDHNVEEAYARHFVSPRKKGCPFEAGAIDVWNSAEISQAWRASTRREIQEGQIQRSCKPVQATLAHAKGGRKVATLPHR